MHGLRLIGGMKDHSIVTELTRAGEALQDQRCLLAEAKAIAATYGKNAYSEFLSRNGRRPDPTEARTIGQLIGARVRASDGSMQPPMTTAERNARRQERVVRRGELERYAQIRRLKDALADLSQNASEPSELVELLCPQIDGSMISDHLEPALQWLIRFAEAYNERSKGSS